MEKLKQKLSSRKLWAAIASAILCIIAACFGEELTPEAVEILKYAVVAGVTYIFGEGIVDVARQVADALGKGKSFELVLPSLGVEGKPEEESEAEVEGFPEANEESFGGSEGENAVMDQDLCADTEKDE